MGGVGELCVGAGDVVGAGVLGVGVGDPPGAGTGDAPAGGAGDAAGIDLNPFADGVSA